MHRRITKTAIIFALAVCVVLCTTVTASASTQYVFDIPIAKPDTNNNTAYFEVMYNWGGIRCEVFMINMTVENNDYEIPHDPSVKVYLYQNSIKISASSTTSASHPNFSAFYITSVGSSNFMTWTDNEKSINYNNILGFRAYGDVSVTNSNDLSLDNDFIINYGTDSLAQNQLNTIISILQNSNNNDVVGAIDQSTNDITQNQEQNTQEIIDNQNQIVENEKNEINSSANGSVDSIVNVVPDIGIASISEGVGKIVNAMSTHSTYCQWTFPSLKIPSINGVFSEIVLIEEKKIDLSAWVNKMPDKALTLVRALCTIGIILFVVYEFIDFVLYCFTLKKNASGKK